MADKQLEAEWTIADLPPEHAWAGLNIDPNLSASEANEQFQLAIRTRHALEGPARAATFKARFEKDVAPFVVDGKVNLTPELIAKKRDRIQQQLDDEYRAAVRDGQRLRLWAGVRLQQELHAAIEPPSRAGSLGFSASTTDRLLAKQVDFAEREDARQWLAEASAVQALDRFQRAVSRDDKGLMAVIDAGALPGKRTESPAEIVALTRLIRLRDEHRVARISPQLRDHVKAYRSALAPTPTEHTLRLVARAIA